MGDVRSEMDTKFVDEKDCLDRVGDRSEDFVYGVEEKSAAQRGVLRDTIGLDVGRGEVTGNSDLE